MRKKMVVAILLAMTMLATLAVPAASAQTADKLKDGVMTELQIVFPGNSSSPADLEAVESAMNAIVQEKMDATVKLHIMEWGVYADQINLMLSSGEDAALIFTWESSKNFANRGQVQPITELAKQYAPEAYAAFERYLDACKANGELYGFPTFHEYTTAGGLICRADILDALGIDPATVKTWDDVEQVLIKVHEAYPDMNLLTSSEISRGVLEYLNTGIFDTVQSGVGIYANSADGTIKAVNTYATDEYLAMAKRAYDWNQKGYFIPDSTILTDTRQELLAAGNTFGYIGKIHPGTATQEIKNSGKDIATLVVTDKVCGTSDVNFAQYMVPTACSTPEKAVAFLNILYSDERMQNLMMYGIEGKDYVVKDETNRVAGYPDGVSSENVGWTNETWLSGNASIAYSWESDPLGIWDSYIDFNNSATLSPLYGFTYDSSNVKNEITAVTNVEDKYRAVIESGYSDPDATVAKFNEELQSAGIQNIVDDMQQQIDAWLAGRS